jgi:hypothetical protein
VPGTTSSRITVRLRIGFAHQLPQLSRQMFANDQVPVSLRAKAPANLIERHTVPCACQVKGSFYRVHVRLHEMTTRKKAKGSMDCYRCGATQRDAKAGKSFANQRLTPAYRQRPKASAPQNCRPAGPQQQRSVGASHLHSSGWRLPGRKHGRQHFTDPRIGPTQPFEY